MPAYGVYPIADALDPGDEISSTYEGRHITLLESDLVHPAHADVYVDKGDPVVSATGRPAIVGVAFKSATAVTDQIAIDTEGIWNLDVVAANDAGDVAVAGGDCIYINTTTAILSKIANQATQVPFGYALGIVGSGLTEAIAVKVHFDQSLDNDKRTYYTVTSGEYTYGKHHTAIFAGGISTGLEYFDQQVTGTQTGLIYGLSTWMELAAGFTAAVNILCPFEVGLYDAGATLTNGRIVLQQIQAILASAPGTSLHIWRINVAAAGGAVTALIAAANPTSVGYSAGTAGTGVVGTIPIADIVGTGVVYIDVHAAVA
ncbi:MAG: hypothetical protein KKD77_22810 [Gammaproteobacteria bacterium]|nr:hypothetical protein [Gammaproteobacteria bacterium]